MNGADLVVLSIIGISAVLSLFRGFVSELLSLVTWLAAIVLALALGPPVADGMLAGIEIASVRYMFGHTLVFLGVLLLGGIGNYIARKLIQKTGMGPTDQMFGFLFGALRGCAVVTVLVLVASFSGLPEAPEWRSSRLLPSFERAAATLITFLPEALRNELEGLRAADLPATA